MPNDELLKFDDWLQRANLQHETPYVLNLEQGSSSLRYIGTYHSFDKSDSIFDFIASECEQFSPSLIMIEGCPPLCPSSQESQRFLEQRAQMSRNDMIAEMGEPGLGIWLALQQGVPVLSPEPELKDEVQFLLDGGVSREETFVYYCFRCFTQYRGQLKFSSPDDFARPSLVNFRQATNWEGFDYSFERLMELGEATWGEKKLRDLSEFDFSPLFNIRSASPELGQGPRHEPAGLSWYFRDLSILRQISKAKRRFDRIFVIYGSGHAVAGEQALKALYS